MTMRFFYVYIILCLDCNFQHLKIPVFQNIGNLTFIKQITKKLLKNILAVEYHKSLHMAQVVSSFYMKYHTNW